MEPVGQSADQLDHVTRQLKLTTEQLDLIQQQIDLQDETIKALSKCSHSPASNGSAESPSANRYSGSVFGQIVLSALDLISTAADAQSSDSRREPSAHGSSDTPERVKGAGSSEARARGAAEIAGGPTEKTSGRGEAARRRDGAQKPLRSSGGPGNRGSPARTHRKEDSPSIESRGTTSRRSLPAARRSTLLRADCQLRVPRTAVRIT